LHRSSHPATIPPGHSWVESPFRLAPNGFGRRGLFRLHWCSAGVIMRPALYKVPSHGVPPVVKRGYRELFRLHWRVASARIKLWVQMGVPVIRIAPDARFQLSGALRCPWPRAGEASGNYIASPGAAFCIPPRSNLRLSAFRFWEESRPRLAAYSLGGVRGLFHGHRRLAMPIATPAGLDAGLCVQAPGPQYRAGQGLCDAPRFFKSRQPPSR
jgi:hypothetical protein